MLNFVKQLYENNQLAVCYFNSELQLVWQNSTAKNITASKQVAALQDLCFMSNFEKAKEKLSKGIACRVIGNPMLEIESLLLQRLDEEDGGILAILAPRAENQVPCLNENAISSVLAQYRNPIFSIYNMLPPLKKAFEESENYENCVYIDSIGRMCYQTIRATTNLSQYFKYQSPYVQCNKTQICLNRFIEDECFAARRFIARTEIGFRYEIDDELIFSQVDPDMFSIAFYNLIANSCLYTNSGNEILVRLEKVKDEYMLVISDEGLGIPDEVQPHIFKPFYSYDPDGSPAIGVGLGLSIVKRVAELHGGSCILTSVLNKGTTVVLRFPIVEGPLDKEKALEASGVYPVGPFSDPYVYLSDICEINPIQTI